MDASIDSNPFAIPNLWKKSPFMLSEDMPDHTLFSPVSLDVTTIKLENPYAPQKNLEDNLRLPDLDAFTFGPLEDVESLDAESGVSGPVSRTGADSDTQLDGGEEADNVWDIVCELEPLPNEAKLFTWEAFLDPGYGEPQGAYLSEAGPQAFDAALYVQDEQREGSGHKRAGTMLKSDLYLASLLALGLGRSSALFSFNISNGSFLQTLEDCSPSGYSRTTAQSVVDSLIVGGNASRFLLEFVERTYANGNPPSSMTALANVVDEVLSSLESRLVKQIPLIVSLLQLQAAFVQPVNVFTKMQTLVKDVISARTNEDIISRIYEKAQVFEQESEWLRLLMLHILARVAKPWLEDIDCWIGLNNDEGHDFGSLHGSLSFIGRAAISLEQGVGKWDFDYVFLPESTPSSLAPAESRLIFETGRSLRLLRDHHPDHPLATKHHRATTPQLEWTFDWRRVEDICAKSKDYERSLASAVCVFGRNGTHADDIDHDVDHVSETAHTAERSEEFNWKVDFENHTLNLAPPTRRCLPDELYDLIVSDSDGGPQTKADAEPFAPPISLTPVLAFSPLISAQARLVNAATIRLLFRSHDLRLHLRLQFHHHLLGDGVFVANLSSALFSPDLSTAERRRGVVRTGTAMGLRLGSRKTWPPASSELQLALMGILTESCQSSTLARKGKPRNEPGEDVAAGTFDISSSSPNLPGNLSFAIRTLSEEDVNKCMDSKSLYALDFLRLQYTPPSPLGAVITPRSLERYDAIFKFLLRLTRMLFVVSHLPRAGLDAEERLFRLSAHHFVSVCANHFVHCCVGETFAAFELFLDEMERKMDEEDTVQELGVLVDEGIGSLRERHEACLEAMMSRLMLRHRQREIMTLFEEILGCVLRFADVLGGDKDRYDTSKRLSQIPGLHKEFKKKVGVFLTVCRRLVCKKGARAATKAGRDSAVQGEDNGTERLVLMLELSGYYPPPKDDTLF
ncbi:hypothetical protein K402DRAFT_409295 [Aulographum hederae CBS 113979]|uniref:Spindle pole body component n=1 Tax=Aulographum hederae CBS 113979 TaxID=1176131 RepID=A0A6G1HHR2_9PEZI|nr:hypothetical protein K402DRAFT_409295 [Aulographum hederae CBS 113979]